MHLDAAIHFWVAGLVCPWRSPALTVMGEFGRRAVAGRAPLEIRLLGPVEVRAAARRFDVGPPQRRVVLAALAVDAGRPVLTETVIDRVWGDRPPAQPRAAIHAHITGLRRLLRQAGAAAQGRAQVDVMHRGDGYVLQTGPQQVDLLRFRDLVAAAGRCTDAAQVELLRMALALWRGPALADVSGEWPARMRDALGLERLDAGVHGARNLLRWARPEQVIGTVRPLVADYPLAEPLVAVLMQALAATGRRAEALGCHTAIRHRLAEELGVDPGPELQALHEAILRDDVARSTAMSSTDEPHGDVPDLVGGDGSPDRPRCTLPTAPGVFIGREKELHRITTAVTDTVAAGTGVAIHAIDGMPGIGKTALATHVGHQLAKRFPDRQFYIDLHAHTAGRQPMQPAEALADLLTADGVDPRFLPATLDGRAGLWRDRMAGRRMLLILDNAASTEQVLPLVPGTADCLVLVTSRHSLGDLPAAVPVRLGVLTPDEAAAMFVRSAPRAAADPQALKDVVAVCGHLPLAISIAASLYVRRRSWTLADLQAEVQRSAEGLLTVTAESRTTAAAFDLSYQQLPPARQRFFRLLGLHPGIEIDTYAAAALTAASVDEAASHLDELARHHLLEEPAYRRYRMHDLVRSYTRALTARVDPDEVRADAVVRLLDFYQHSAARADRWLARHTRPVGSTAAGAELTSWRQGARWLRAERANLLACIHHSAAAELAEHTVALTAAVAGMLRTDGPLTLAADLHSAALEPAQRLDDPYAHANALHNLADIRLLTAAYSDAARLLHQVLDLRRALGDRPGEAHALLDLSGVRWLAGDYAEAADLLRRSLDMYAELDDRGGQANALRELGIIGLVTGDYPGAASHLEDSLDLYRAIGAEPGQANALREVGVLRLTMGDYPAAATMFGRALDLYRAIGDRRGQATALHELGAIWRLTGDVSASADLLGRALELFRTLGSRRGEACTLDGLGIVRRLTGDHPGALDLHRQALAMHQALGNRHNEAITSTHLAVVIYQTGDHTTAADLLHHALDVFRDLGTPDDEAEALNHLGTVHRLTGQPARALTRHRQALSIARRIHHRLEEARSLEGIGRGHLDLDDRTAAGVHLHEAVDLYKRLGLPEDADLAATLATLDCAPGGPRTTAAHHRGG